MTIAKSDLEKILSLAPGPKPPEGLKERLLMDVFTPGEQVSNRPIWKRSARDWLRRWWAALAPAMASAACAVILGIQQSEIESLKGELQVPSTHAISAQSSGGTTGSPLPAKSSAAEQDELARLKQLTAELRSEIAQLEQLRAENQKLRERLSAPAVAGFSTEEIGDLEKLSEKALSIQCINNLKQFGLAVRIWANDQNELQPPNVVSMSNELSTPKILVCPADRSRQVAMDWAGFTSANLSYEYFVSPDFSLMPPTRVLARCPIHGHIGLCDGSVQSQVAKTHPDWLTERNGMMYLERATVTTNIITR